MAMTTAELAEKINATVHGDASVKITACAALDEAGPSDLSFLTNRKYAGRLAESKAGAVVLSAEDAKSIDGRTVLIAEDAYFAFREAIVLLHGFRQQPAASISELAQINASATLGSNVHVGPFVVIEAEAVVGDNCVLYPHTYVGTGATVGSDCILYPNVTIYDRCILGHRVTLHAGCSIGQDGFGYATHQGAHHKIPQTGIARIEDDVEMGANCSVDRATLGETVVAAGSKFSNSVTIGHGTKVGRHNLFVAQVGLAGSVQTGDYVAMGGQVGVAGHLKIGRQVQIAATSGVMQDVPDNVQVGGTPAVPLGEAFRVHVATQRLPEMVTQFKKLQKRVAELEKKLGQRS